jgi:hypothetical protein
MTVSRDIIGYEIFSAPMVRGVLRMVAGGGVTEHGWTRSAELEARRWTWAQPADLAKPDIDATQREIQKLPRVAGQPGTC